MDYISGVFISASTYWATGAIAAIAVVILGKCSGKTYTKAVYPAAKLYLIVFCIGLIVGLISPSNTYKFKAERLPNPVAEVPVEAPEQNVDLGIKMDQDTKRKENFDNLIDWKSRTN